MKWPGPAITKGLSQELWYNCRSRKHYKHVATSCSGFFLAEDKCSTCLHIHFSLCCKGQVLPLYWGYRRDYHLPAFPQASLVLMDRRSEYHKIFVSEEKKNMGYWWWYCTRHLFYCLHLSPFFLHLEGKVSLGLLQTLDSGPFYNLLLSESRVGVVLCVELGQIQASVLGIVSGLDAQKSFQQKQDSG